MSPLPTAYDNRSGGCSGPSPSGPPGSPDGPYMPYNQPHPYASISQTPTNHGIIPPAIQNPGPFPRNSGIPSPMGGNVPNDYHFGGQPGSLSSGPSTSGSHHPPAVDYNSGGWPGSLASGTSTFGSSPSDASLANAPPLAPEYPTAPIARRDASKVNFVTKYVRELCSSVLSYVSKLLLQRRASIEPDFTHSRVWFVTFAIEGIILRDTDVHRLPSERKSSGLHHWQQMGHWDYSRNWGFGF
jgi:hypothetical protein